MFNRREFLWVGALALAQLASGCSSLPADLRVRLLKDSLPSRVLGGFRQEIAQSVALAFEPEAKLKGIWNRLQAWQENASQDQNGAADLVTLGDYWLASAISEELVQPLDLKQLSGWQRLPPRWKSLVQRDHQGQLDDSGPIWGAPYRWGCTAIAYRREQFESLGWTPTDWSDLWREELRDRISLLNQPREVIGLTLKKLGFSYNTRDLNSVPNLEQELLALNKQAKFYSSDSYLQPLILGDTWLAVGWSNDLLPVQARYPQIEVLMPHPGTALWADLWVQPSSKTTNPQKSKVPDSPSLLQQWINFCWQPQPATQISVLSHSASPIILTMNPAELPQDLREHPLLFPDPQILEKSDFLHPLSESIFEQYQSLWREMRT